MDSNNKIFGKSLVARISKAAESAQTKGESRITSLIALGFCVTEAKVAFQSFKKASPEEAKGLKQAETLEALFGFGKMQQSRLERAAQVPTETTEAFFKACREDSKLSLSVEGLLKYAEALNKGEGEEGEGEGEEGEGEGEAAPAAPEAKPLLTISARLADAELGSNFSMRIMPDGAVKTTAKAADVRAAIALLEAALKGFPEAETETEA